MPHTPLRTSIGRRWRKEQKERQEGRCAYCRGLLNGGKKNTLEHVIPRGWGGPHSTYFNLLIVCYPCNSRKNDFENSVDRVHRNLPGIEKCEKLVGLLWDEMLRGKLDLSIRLRYMRMHVQQATYHPDWAMVVSHRRVLFFGEQHARDLR